MGINSLISKHGDKILINGIATDAYIDTVKAYRFNRTSNVFEFFDYIQVLTKVKLSENDTVNIDGELYLWHETDEEVHRNGGIVYYSNILFKNPFTKDAKFHNQAPAQSGCNLPISQPAYKTAKVYIKTIKPEDYIQYSFDGKPPITHKIVMQYQSGISTSDKIVISGRSFEILAVENINEDNRFLVFLCVEVLDA